MKPSIRTESAAMPWARGLSCLALLATTGVAGPARALQIVLRGASWGETEVHWRFERVDSFE